MLHPEFPVVEGRYEMTRHWAVTLPQPFNRRFEDDSLVFWRPGITVWSIVWNNDKQETQPERLAWLCSQASPEAFDTQTIIDGDMTRYAYRLTEQREESVVHALYAFAIGVGGHVQMAIYFDHETDLKAAQQIWLSLAETQPLDRPVNPRTKNFKITGDQIRELIPNSGGCYASDRITVDGMPVGYLYREQPDFEADSGWRFFSGDESQEYADTPENFGIYKVNTICNYDPSIISTLGAPIGSAFGRVPGTDRFESENLTEEESDNS